MSLLIAMLLPALSGARHQARILQCSSNLRQIGIAWNAYLGDHGMAFPEWRQNMQWFYGGKHPALFRSRFELPYRPLNPYVALTQTASEGSPVFACSEDRDIRAGNGGLGPTQGHTTHAYYGNSYMMNFLLLYRFDNYLRKLPVAMGDIELDHAQVVLAGDCQWYYTVNDVHWDAAFHNRHDQMNLLFLDGHASYLPLVRGEGHTDTYSFLIKRPPPKEEEPE